ncbi:hypothetical protein AUJ17_02960 [Candidatus Micrarchaeota archaeon CG1_02_47_40]|nr:MAG: hypothetical protein AUJ17_02960 [Candidatus Micrarchaeota archaeon CG1_02_47_40]
MAKRAVAKPAQKQTAKDPKVALVLGIFGTLLFGLLPSLGMYYIGKKKRAIVWNVIYWVVAGIMALLGSICCFPWLIIPIFAIVIIYDTYKIAKGEKEILPKVLE